MAWVATRCRRNYDMQSHDQDVGLEFKNFNFHMMFQKNTTKGDF